jgi:hypothetical protein
MIEWEHEAERKAPDNWAALISLLIDLLQFGNSQSDIERTNLVGEV